MSQVDVPVPVDEDGNPNFLTEADIYDPEREQAFCAHDNAEEWDEDSGDSMNHVEVYRVRICPDCGMEASVRIR